MRLRDKQSGLRLQTGALPWRIRDDDEIEVLLVTGRQSKRWLIPKGWPMIGKSLAAAAAQEAFEEAGVEGRIDPKPIGSFRHSKQHLIFGSIEVRILVHSLRVESELPKWPEAAQRERRWFSSDAATQKVNSKALGRLIASLARRLENSRS